MMSLESTTQDVQVGEEPTVKKLENILSNPALLLTTPDIKRSDNKRLILTFQYAVETGNSFMRFMKSEYDGLQTDLSPSGEFIFLDDESFGAVHLKNAVINTLTCGFFGLKVLPHYTFAAASQKFLDAVSKLPEGEEKSIMQAFAKAGNVAFNMRRAAMLQGEEVKRKQFGLRFLQAAIKDAGLGSKEAETLQIEYLNGKLPKSYRYALDLESGWKVIKEKLDAKINALSVSPA